MNCEAWSYLNHTASKLLRTDLCSLHIGIAQSGQGMLFPIKSALLLGYLAASFSRAAPVAQTTVVGAIYTLHNVQNASIIAMSVSENGTIFGSGVSTPTGGKGSSGQTGKGQPNVGALFSSDAVVAQDNVRIPSPIPLPHAR